ncbi:MAG: anaerobic magnesium-protoporphyrin IX monomethyl ester cyclase, partial [Candidatus Paceibacteria bacterium]
SMKVSLIYAKNQNLRTQAAELFANDDATAGDGARDEIFPPLGITVLAAWLIKAGYDVRLCDDSIESMETVREFMDWADVVGISSLTPNARRARELGQMCRNDFGKPTIFGGPHPTTNPEFFLESGAADVCCAGEGDITIQELLPVIHERDKWESVKSLSYLKDGEVFSTPRRELLQDMDSVPMPAYHLWDMPRYMRLMVNPCVTAITSRGCPYECTFCDAEMTPRKYRSMSPGATVDLMEHILKTYDPPQIVLFDDLFTIQRKRVIAICKEIVKRGLFFEWACESRVDTMDFEMLRWLRKAGCVKIYYGLESGSPRLLNTMKKGVTLEKVLEGSRLNREVGMYYKFYILYGFPEDRPEDHKATEDLVAKTLPNAISCGVLQPIPGTAVYEQLKPLLIRDVAEMDFNYWHATESFKHPYFKHEELQEARERLLRVHAAAVSSLKSKLIRKFDRLSAMMRHPELIGDYFEIRSRRKRFLKRVQDSEWSYVYNEARSEHANQIPRVVTD